MTFEKQDRAFAVTGVAIVVAVRELSPGFAQVARSDWLTAQHTEGFQAGRPAIHQYESHVAPPGERGDAQCIRLTALLWIGDCRFVKREHRHDVSPAVTG
jgi:hypothetical protein